MNPNEQHTQPHQETPTTPVPNIASNPLEAQQPASQPFIPQPSVGSLPLNQPVLPGADSSKYEKRVKIIAIIVIVLGIIGAVSSFMDMSANGGVFSFVVAIFQIAIGFGLYKFHKLAYIAFNVFAFLAILGYLFSFVGLALTGFMTIVLGGLFGILFLVTLIATLTFLLTALILIHPKPVRELFHW